MKEVIVLGMHRSGTSMVAGILERLGVHMGERLEGKAYHNPLGHYEDLDFTVVNDRILEASGGSWDDPPSASEIVKQDFSKEIRSLVDARKDLASWGWKDPRTSLTVDHYLKHLEDPCVIFCHRKPDAVAASLRKRDGMPDQKARRLKRTYDARVRAFLRGHKHLPHLDVTYERVLESPDSQVERIVEFLGLEPSRRDLKRATKFVKPREKLFLLKAWHAVKAICTKPHVVLKVLWKRFFPG